MKCLLIAACLALLCVNAAAQQNWPVKAVRVIVPNAAGAVPDTVARLVTESLSRATGQAWIVDNRAGGQGVIGSELAAKAAPDGYTFFIGGAENFVLAPRLMKTVPYDPVRDFSPLAVIIDSGNLAIVVRDEFPSKSLKEFIAAAKARPGKLTFASTVITTEMLGNWFKKRAGIELVNVPYKTVTQAIQDLLGGRVDSLVVSMSPVEALARAGKVRALAMSATARIPGWDLVETFSETLPGLSLVGWQVMAAPTSTPAELLQRVNREVNATVKTPDFARRVAQFGWYNNHGSRSVEEADAFLRAQRENWGRVIDELGIKPE